MRRRLVLTLLLLTVSVGTARTVAASPDCSKWVAEYRQKLENDQRVRRAMATQRRARAYMKRKVAGYVKPKPRVINVADHPRPRRPRLTPADLMKRFKIVCGDLPDDETATVLPPDPPPAFALARPFIPGVENNVPIDTPPPTVTGLVPTTPQSPPIPSIPTGPGIPPIEPPPPVNPPIPPAVPEPNTLLMVASGVAGLARMAYRKRK
jgi:hypothetical protein